MIQKIIMESEALQSNTVLQVVFPKHVICEKLLILLHGKLHPEKSMESFETMPRELELEELSRNYRLMIVMPLMKNQYYISTRDYDCDRFISEELLKFMTEHFSLSDSAEVILGGVSMGGFGAALIGAHTGISSKILSISGSYIVDDVVVGNPEVWGKLTPQSYDLNKYFLYYFLPLDDAVDSTQKNAIAALQLFLERNEKPKFVVTCGTEDWLYSRNKKMTKVLAQYGIDFYFYSQDGKTHEEECFKEGLWKAMSIIVNES